MFPNPLFRLPAKSFKSLVVTAFSLTGLGLGLLPSFAPHSTGIVWMAPAQAQAESFSDEQVKDYARVLIEIEQLRQDIRAELKKRMGSDIPNLKCDESDTLDEFPAGEPRNIAKRYCDDGKKIVEKYNLTTDVFNKITSELPKDAALRKRVQDAMQR